MIDYLIMLLSTDWFVPYWSEIGIDLDDATKIDIKNGCRAIVSAFIDGAAEYYEINFSETRRLETDAMFTDLLIKTRTTDVMSGVARQWSNQPRDVLSTTRMLRLLTRDLQLNGLGQSNPALDSSILTKVRDMTADHHSYALPFERLAMESRSTWDAYLRDLFKDQPTALVDNLEPFVNERRLRSLWARISEQLNRREKEYLIRWCRDMAKSQGVRGDTIPYYIS